MIRWLCEGLVIHSSSGHEVPAMLRLQSGHVGDNRQQILQKEVPILSSCSWQEQYTMYGDENLRRSNKGLENGSVVRNAS